MNVDTTTSQGSMPSSHRTVDSGRSTTVVCRADGDPIHGAFDLNLPTVDLDHIHSTRMANKLALQEVGVADKVRNELIDGVIVNFMGVPIWAILPASMMMILSEMDMASD